MHSEGYAAKVRRNPHFQIYSPLQILSSIHSPYSFFTYGRTQTSYPKHFISEQKPEADFCVFAQAFVRYTAKEAFPGESVQVLSNGAYQVGSDIGQRVVFLLGLHLLGCPIQL